jgi:hypothetical protein
MKTPLCPFLKKACVEHDCMLWTHVTMQADPQTGASKDQFGCAVAWMPIIFLEGARQTRNVQASVDSMRNEVVQRQDTLNAAIEERKHERIADVDRKYLDGRPHTNRVHDYPINALPDGGEE